MTKTKLTKIIVDFIMYFDFIFLMSHGTVRNLGWHAYAGIALFVLFVVHHVLNLWFYKTVANGKYNVQRILLSSTAWVLLILMILMAVSSVFATGAVFEWSPLRFTQFWRTLHLMSTSWAYMIMSFHLALHVQSPLKKLDKKLESKSGKILLYITYCFVIIAGCYAFYQTQIYYYLFNVGNWKMAAPNIVVSCLEYMGITAGIISGYHLINHKK
ncbi:MAG: hypothetical protein MJ174_10125 [Treponema sp.]|nr:hypothetical protein [Treponema sp.]